MKQLICLLFTIYFFAAATSQNVAINIDGSAANNSAMLDIKSSTKGMLVPRMTTAQRTVIVSPANGLLVYDTDVNSFWYYNGSVWTDLTGSGGANGTNWKLSGNSGTAPSSDFIGTIDNQSLTFKVNSQRHGLLHPNGNIFWGNDAGLSNVSHGNVAIGARALNNSTRSNQIAIGDSALMSNINGWQNVAIGSKSMMNSTTHYNTAVGFETLKSHTTGSGNTAIGWHALFSDIDGMYNTVIGSSALRNSTTGTYNVAIGHAAMANSNDASSNIAIGHQALIQTTAYDNISMGNNSMLNTTSGFNNCAFGYSSMHYNSTGFQNIGLGAYSLYNNATGSNNIAIGFFADVTANNLTNAIALGYNAKVNASNKVVIGNSSVTSIGGFVNWSNFSDGRFKQNVKEDVPGLAFINKLRPVTYTLNVDAINDFNSKGFPDEKKKQLVNDENKNEVYTGFMAQEVEQAAKSLNYNFSGIDKPKDESKQTYALRYSDFVVPLVKAIQEQQKMIHDLKKEIEALKKNY